MTRTLYSLVPLCLLLLITGCVSVPEHSVDHQKAARVNANLGLRYLDKGQYERAVGYLKRSLQYDSSNVRANLGMALFYQHLDKPAKARNYYNKIIDAQARPAIINPYAVFLCQQGKTQKAVEYFKRAADDYRNNRPAGALANAGYCLDQAGQQERAATFYEKALSKNKNQPTALTRMAHIRYNQGQYLGARAFIERADAVIDLSPKMLLLGARVEQALGDRKAAKQYLRRYNQHKSDAALALSDLQGQSN